MRKPIGYVDLPVLIFTKRENQKVTNFLDFKNIKKIRSK